MKLANALSIITELYQALQIVLPPTLKAVSQDPSLLWPTQWKAVSGIFMAHLWLVVGAGVDENSKSAKERLLVPSDEDKRPHGVVLDLGAGHGYTANYLDRGRVSHYVALEPNIHMHPQLRALANEAGFHESDGSLIILSCGAEDTMTILSSLNSAGISTTTPPIDTIVSILTLCTIPNPQQTLTTLARDILKSGGLFFTYEHVLSHREDIAWWQRFWAPFWSVLFDGCRMERPIDMYMKTLELEREDGTKESVWSDWKSWSKDGEDEDEETLFGHAIGIYIRK